MELKEVLHYYLGQKCVNEENEIAVFNSIHTDGTCRLNYEGSKTRFSICGPEHFKLHLRPLSSMTEDHAKGFCNWDENRADKWEGFSTTNWLLEIKFIIEGETNPSYYRYSLTQLSPRQFHYLLKQGFDLFGLIDSKQAIEITNKK